MTNEIHRQKEKEAHICRNRVFRVLIALMHWDVLSLLLWIKEVFKLSEFSSLMQIHYPTDVNQEVLKQLPHVITGVNLFHFYFCVHIAVIQEVDVCYFDLKVEKIINKE